MTKIKPYWTTSQTMQQIWNLSTRKGLSKMGGGGVQVVGKRRYLMLVNLNKQTKGRVV